MIGALTGIVLPTWARWLAIAALVLSGYGLGRLQEARHDVVVHEAAAKKEATRVITVVQKEVETVVRIQTLYQDRIQKVYVKEKELADIIPILIPPVVDHDFPVPVGFVRIAAASWSGAAPGPASSADDQPSGVPISAVASAEVANAAACFVWREQALGWRAFYAGQQLSINGKAGSWYTPEPDDGTLSH